MFQMLCNIYYKNRHILISLKCYKQSVLCFRLLVSSQKTRLITMPQIRKIPHSFPDKLKKIKIKKKTGSRKNTTQLVIKPRDRNN